MIDGIILEIKMLYASQSYLVVYFLNSLDISKLNVIIPGAIITKQFRGHQKPEERKKEQYNTDDTIFV